MDRARDAESTSDPAILRRLDAYRDQGLAQVTGWLEDESAEVMALLLGHQLELGVRGNVAEIGVHHGKSFLLVANGARGDEQAVALDVFGDQDKKVDRSGLGDRGVFETNIAAWAPDVDVYGQGSPRHRRRAWEPAAGDERRAAARKRGRRLARELADARHRIDSMETSTWWRMTAPARRATDWLRHRR